MKPVLDKMIDMVVGALSGGAKEFYNREFDFFSNVTGISGKLKPFIKKTKLEKKVRSSLYSYKLSNIDFRPRSTRKWQRSV